jgi:hypothetical protein
MKGIRKAVVGMGFGIVGLASIHLQAEQTFNGIYDFHNVNNTSGTTDPTPPPVAPGVTFGSFSAVGYIGNCPVSGRFSWQWNDVGSHDGDDDFANFTAHLNSGRYFEVTLAPESGYLLDVDTIAFGVRRSSNGIRSYAVRTSLDGFEANLAGRINPANPNLGVGPDNSFRWLFDATGTTADQNGSQLILGSAFDSLGSAITFRFYGWNSEIGLGSFSIDNVVFSGSVRPVPEPAATALLPLGTMLLWVKRRQRLKSIGARQQKGTVPRRGL